MRYRCILCPIDGSELSGKSEEVAAYLSRISGARLLLAHIMQQWRGSDLLATDSPEWQAIRKNWLNEGRALLEKEAAKLKEEGVVYVKTELRDGEVAYEILTLANEQHADLIVMGIRRFSPLERLFGDNLSDVISRDAPCPILWVFG